MTPFSSALEIERIDPGARLTNIYIVLYGSAGGTGRRDRRTLGPHKARGPQLAIGPCTAFGAGSTWRTV